MDVIPKPLGHKGLSIRISELPLNQKRINYKKDIHLLNAITVSLLPSGPLSDYEFGSTADFFFKFTLELLLRIDDFCHVYIDRVYHILI